MRPRRLISSSSAHDAPEETGLRPHHASIWLQELMFMESEGRGFCSRFELPVILKGVSLPPETVRLNLGSVSEG